MKLSLTILLGGKEELKQRTLGVVNYDYHLFVPNTIICDILKTDLEASDRENILLQGISKFAQRPRGYARCTGTVRKISLRTPVG